MDNPLGRPLLSKEQIDDIFRKLEPRLKTGLSINKACLEAQVPKSTVYDLLHENNTFAERVEAARNYHAILLNDIVTKELQRISQMAGTLPLSTNEIKLIQWLAMNSVITKEEYVDRANTEDKKEYTITPSNDNEYRERIASIIEKAAKQQVLPQETNLPTSIPDIA